MANNQLAIDVNFSSIRFTRLNGSFVVEEKEYHFKEKQDYRYKQQLEEFWNETGWKAEQFDDMTLSWSGFQTTLVPMNVFGESSKEAIYRLSFGDVEASSEIDYNRLPMQGVVNCFSLPTWVKSFFVLRFPRVIIQHEGTHVLRGIFAGQTFKLKTRLIFHEAHFLIVITKENNLQFYSSFEYQSLEDVAYYLGFSLQQLGYSNLENEVELSNGAGSAIDLAECETLLKKVIAPQTTFIQTNYLVEKYQQLCV